MPPFLARWCDMPSRDVRTDASCWFMAAVGRSLTCVSAHHRPPLYVPMLQSTPRITGLASRGKTPSRISSPTLSTATNGTRLCMAATPQQASRSRTQTQTHSSRQRHLRQQTAQGLAAVTQQTMAPYVGLNLLITACVWHAAALAAPCRPVYVYASGGTHP